MTAQPKGSSLIDGINNEETTVMLISQREDNE
jgi:hypothetical protein